MDIEIRRSKSFSIFPALGLSALLVFMYIDLQNQLFHWERFNPDGMDTILFLILSLMVTISWAGVFDTKPIYLITNHGILHRGNIFRRSADILIKWKDVEYFFIEAVRNRGIMTEKILFKITGTQKYFKLVITGTDCAKDVLLETIKEKAIKYGFHDLGYESGNHTRF